MKRTTNFQRIGSKSNADVGRKFELAAREHFLKQKIILEINFPVLIGVGKVKRSRKFDLGSNDPSILVECKSHKWTKGDNVPSAKITVWNEAMFYFHLVPSQYRKIFFVLRNISKKRKMSLAEYYVSNHDHLIPTDVEILEYDEKLKKVIKIR